MVSRISRDDAPVPEVLKADEDFRERVLITNSFSPCGLFPGACKVQVTPLTVEGARDLVTGKRVVVTLADLAVLKKVDGESVAMLSPAEIPQAYTQSLKVPSVYMNQGEVKLPLGAGDRVLLGEIVPVLDAPQSKVLIQVGRKPKVRAEVEWSLVEVLEA